MKMPNDDIEQVLWDAAEQHCDRLEGILEQSKRPAWAQRIRERHQLVMDGGSVYRRAMPLY